MAFEAGQLVVKLSIDDKEAKDKIKNIQKDLSTTSDRAADKFREAADKLTKVLDNAWTAAKQHASTFINWFNTKFPSIGKWVAKTRDGIVEMWRKFKLGSLSVIGKLINNAGLKVGELKGNFLTAASTALSRGVSSIKNLGSAGFKTLFSGGLVQGLTSLSTKAIAAGGALGVLGFGFKKATEIAFKFTKTIYDAVKAAGLLEQGSRAFINIITASGANATAILEGLRKATGGMIDDARLKKLASTGTLLGVDPKKIVQLAEIAGPAAVALGEDINSMFDSIIRGTARQSPLILDNLGISLKDLTSKEEAYAASIGKTVDGLTEEEKRTFFVNFVLSKKQEVLDKVGDATRGAYTNTAIFEAKLQNLADTTKLWIAQALEPSTLSLIQFATEIEKLLNVIPNLKLALSAIGLAFANQINQGLALMNVGMSAMASVAAMNLGKFDLALAYARDAMNTMAKAAGYKGTAKGTAKDKPAIGKPTKDSKILGETPAELKDRVKALTSEVNTLSSQLYESEYNHRIKQAKATLDEELKLYKDSFEGQRLARKKHYLTVAAINKEFAEKRAEEIKRVEAEAQSVEQKRLAELEKEQEEYRKEIEAVMEDSQQSVQVIEEIEDLKVEALGKGFANQLAEIDRWRDKQLDKYRDWKEAEVLIELIAQQRKREIIEEYQKKADEDREKEDEDREAEIEKTRTSVEEAIDEINSAYQEAADRMKSATDSIKTSFEELLNIFGNTQNKMTGFVAFLGSTFGSVISEAAGIFGKFAKAEKGASKDGVKCNDSLGESFKKLGANVIESLKQQAVVQAVMEFAAGLAALARLDFRAAGLHFASSALYGTIAAMQIATALGAGGGGGGNYYNNSANEPGGGSYTYSLDNVNPNTGTNVTIYAMDSQSFSDFANRNKGAFAVAVEGALRNNVARKKIGNNL